MYPSLKGLKPSTGMASALLLLAILMLFSSCRKNEGPGGTGSITGRITEYFYNDDYSRLIYKKTAVDEEVFLMYGDENLLGDRTFTSLSGEFRFKYLYPGRYYIYFLSGDSTASLDVEREVIRLVVLDRGEEVDLGEMARLTALEFDDGAAVIKGSVKVINYVDESRWPNMVPEYIAFAHEHEVYLTYGEHTFYDERVRTQDNGVFEFRNLIPGDYRVFLYSDDLTRVTEDVVIEFEVTISEMDQVIDLGEITIHQL